MKQTVVKIMLCVAAAALLFTACTPKSAAADSTAAPVQREQTNTQKATEPPQVTPEATIIEPGALLSLEDASKLSGLVLVNTENKDTPVVGQKIVVYKSADDGDYFQIALHQQAYMPASAPLTPTELFQQTVAAFPDGKKIEGLGDQAVEAKPFIHALYKDYYLTFASTCPDEKLIEAAKAAIENLAKIVG